MPLTHPPGEFLYWGHIPQTLCQRGSRSLWTLRDRFEIVTNVFAPIHSPTGFQLTVLIFLSLIRQNL